MKLLAFVGSPRKGGNSDILTDEILRGAEEKGYDCEKIYLSDLSLSPCNACYACRPCGQCIKNDDGNSLYQKLIDADVIVLSSPVYFYSVSAQMKIFIDRSLPYYQKIRDKRFMFILTAAADEKLMKRAAEALYGFTDCLPGSFVLSVLFADGVYKKGEVKNTRAFHDAYLMGWQL